MVRPILSLFALLASSGGLTLVGKAPPPAAPQGAARPGGAYSAPVRTAPTPAADPGVATTATGDETITGGDGATTAPDTTVPAPLPPSGAVGLARTSPTQPRVVPPSAGEPIGVAPPDRVNLTAVTAQEIAGAQLVLQGLGLYRGPINGVLTGPTRAALRLFQAQARLPVTGHPDLRTMEVLGVTDDGDDTTDTTTTDTIEEVQTAVGLPVTGELDEATLEVLSEGLVPREGGLPVVRFRDTLPMAAGAP